MCQWLDAVSTFLILVTLDIGRIAGTLDFSPSSWRAQPSALMLLVLGGSQMCGQLGACFPHTPTSHPFLQHISVAILYRKCNHSGDLGEVHFGPSCHKGLLSVTHSRTDHLGLEPVRSMRSSSAFFLSSRRSFCCFVYVSVYVWKPEVNFRGPLSDAMYFASEIGSLTGPKVTKQASLAGHEVPGPTCVHLPSMGVSMPGCLILVLRIKLRFLGLHGMHFSS